MILRDLDHKDERGRTRRIREDLGIENVPQDTERIRDGELLERTCLVLWEFLMLAQLGHP